MALPSVPPGSYRIQTYDDLTEAMAVPPRPTYETTIQVGQGKQKILINVPYRKSLGTRPPSPVLE